MPNAISAACRYAGAEQFHGQTIITAYAGINALDEPRQLARQGWQEKHATLALDQLTRTGYVLSGQVKGTNTP